jgi:hypothetical protein
VQLCAIQKKFETGGSLGDMDAEGGDCQTGGTPSRGRTVRKKGSVKPSGATGPANITWRQDVGGSAVEVSKIAGHSKVDTTLDYTIIGGKRQYTLTRRIQEEIAQGGGNQETGGGVSRRFSADTRPPRERLV